EAKTTSIDLEQSFKIKATISNRGQSPVVLVQPGDGSESAWRTPIVSWSAIRITDDRKVEHPSKPPLYKGLRCGNVNALEKSEIIKLAPGQSKELCWVGWPMIEEPGTYSVVLYYFNVPDIAWKGGPLGPHDPEAMRQVRDSFECSLTSNELRLVV